MKSHWTLLTSSAGDRLAFLIQRAAIVAMALLIPLAVFPTGASIPEHAKVAAMGVFLSLIAAAALWTPQPVLQRLDRWTVALLASWLVLLSVSTLMAVSWDRAVFGVHYRYNGLLLNAGYGLMALMAARVALVDRRLLELFAWAAAGAACLAGLIGAAQYFGAQNDWLLLRGVRERPRGTFSNSSLFGAYMTYSLPFVAALAMRSREKWAFAGYMTIFVIAAFGWRAAASRGCWLAGGAALLATAIVCIVYTREGATRQCRLIRAHIMAVALLAIFILFPPERYIAPLGNWIGDRPLTEDLRVFLNIDAVERLRSAMDSEDLTRRTRIDLWMTALAVWRDYPWFGSGPDTFSFFYQQNRPVADVRAYGPDAVAHDAHNLLLHNLAVWGALPTLAWLGLLARVLWVFVRRCARETTEWREIASVSVIVFVAAHAMQLLVVGSLSLHTSLWLLLGAMIGLGATRTIETPVSEHGVRVTRERGSLAPRVAALIVICLGPALAIVPLRADSIFTQGTRHASEERMDEAIAAYERAARLLPFREEFSERLCAAWLAVGVERRDGAMILRAEQEAQRLVERFPLQSRFYALRGRIAMLNADRFGDMRHVENALIDFRQAAQLHPVQPVYRGLVGQAAARLGHSDEARAAFERAIELSHGDETDFYREWLNQLDKREDSGAMIPLELDRVER